MSLDRSESWTRCNGKEYPACPEYGDMAEYSCAAGDVKFGERGIEAWPSVLLWADGGIGMPLNSDH